MGKGGGTEVEGDILYSVDWKVKKYGILEYVTVVRFGD